MSVEAFEMMIKGTRQSNKLSSNMLNWAGPISSCRALLYAFYCGTNAADVSEMEIMAGLNRFGVDNPVPVVTKRLAFYGNDETSFTLLEEFKKLA